MEWDNRNVRDHPANQGESRDYSLPSLNPGVVFSFPQAMPQKSMPSVATDGGVQLRVFQTDRNSACALKSLEPLGIASLFPGLAILWSTENF